MPIVDVERLKAGGQKFASGFTTGQKVMSVLGVAALGFGLMMFTQWSATTDYAPLYSNLNPKDTGDVAKALDGMNVPYKLSGGGNTVLVPRANLYKARVDLSSKGLPANNDGYSLLDKGGITTSNFMQNVNYQRAVQRELANTIMAMRGVQNATVNLALPSDDPFVGADEKKTTAAVMVDTGSSPLQNEQIQAVVHLVASSVKDLAPNAITVTDTSGNLLYTGDKSAAMSSAENLSKQLAQEDALRTKLERQLSTLLGPGHFAVTVGLELDHSKSTRTSSKSTPVLDPSTNKPIAASSSDKTTRLTTEGGSSSNIGQAPGGITGEQTEFEENSTQQNGQFNTENEEVTKAGDVIKRKTVTVSLDKSVVSDADVPRFTAIMTVAAGIDTTRKDEIVVQAMPMDKKVQELAQSSFAKTAAPKTPESPLDIMGIARYIATLLIVAIVLFLAWRSVKKAQAAMTPTRTPIDLVALEEEHLQQQHEMALAAGSIGELPSGATRPGAPKAIESSRSSIELEVVDLIERQPEEVAQTLRSWLADRRT